MGNNIPCAPVAIDLSTMRDVANIAAIIRTTAPKRSDHGARLKNTHHRTIANPPPSPAKHPDEHGFGDDDRDDKPKQALQYHDDHAGPQPERLPNWNFHLYLVYHFPEISKTKVELLCERALPFNEKPASGLTVNGPASRCPL